METKNIMSDIQMNLKVPKNKLNKFGGYKYRSCEDIVEAAKPLLAKHNAHLNISDEVVHIGERFYVKATAKIISVTREVIGQSIGWAREEETKKGMDGSQITGAASSYARKYALNGLLGIDDTKDADTHETTTEAITTPAKQPHKQAAQVDGTKPQLVVEEDSIMHPKHSVGQLAPPIQNRKDDPDTRPWLTEKQFKQAINRVSGGDLTVYHKTTEEFRMKRDYRTQLDETYQFAKSLI